MLVYNARNQFYSSLNIRRTLMAANGLIPDQFHFKRLEIANTDACFNRSYCGTSMAFFGVIATTD